MRHVFHINFLALRINHNLVRMPAVLSNYLKLLWLHVLIELFIEHVFVLLKVTSPFVKMIKYWILDVSKTKSAIEYSTAVVFVSLSEARVLV